MRTVFGELLRHAIRSRNTSISQWAKRVGCTHGQVSNIIAGRRSMPLPKLDAWCVELGLSGDARDRFVHLAYLSHLSAPVRAHVERVEARHDAALREIAALRAQLEGANEQLRRVRRLDAIPHAQDQQLRVAEGETEPASVSPAHATTG